MSRRQGNLTRMRCTGLFTAGVMVAMTASAPAQSPVVPLGSGTSADPYLISELGHLVWMGDNVATSSSQYYTMTADIDASATAGWNDAETGTEVLEGFRPVGTSSGSFNGIFDGNGHIITGLFVNRATTSCVGFWGYLGRAGQVRNLGLVGGAISGQDEVGGLIGRNSGKIANCFTTGMVTGSSSVGGLIGNDRASGSVTNCFATGAVAGGHAVGGLIGWTYSPVSNCYSTAAVTRSEPYSDTGSGVRDMGGLVGCGGPASNSYWDLQTSGQSTSTSGTGKTTAEMKQQATFTGWDFAGTWDIVEGTSYPYLRTAPPPFRLSVEIIGPGSVTIDPASADGTYAPGTAVTLTAVPDGPTTALLYWTGAVSRDSPTTTVIMDTHKLVRARFGPMIEINSLADLAKIGNDPAYPLAGTLYSLTTDIDASPTAEWNDDGTDTDVLEGFKPIGTYSSLDVTSFRGIFDGHGHSISGLVVNRPTSGSAGLFGCIGSGGWVRNLNIVGGDITARSCVGGLVGSVRCGTVSGCSTTGEVTLTGSDAGGLVGYNDSGTISDCHATSSVSGAGTWFGGLAGYNRGVIAGCDATSSVTGTQAQSQVGGLIGGNDIPAVVLNCHAAGAITGFPDGGGLVGWNCGTLSECYATGAVKGTGSSGRVGGLVGYNGSTGAIERCYATGSVTGKQPSKEVVGHANADAFSNESVARALAGTELHIGGLVGEAHSGRILDSYATGQVTGTGLTIGGLVGDNDSGMIRGCRATGAVSGDANSVGGLIGHNDSGTITDCRATGAVTGTGTPNEIGGLIGYNVSSSVSDCSAAGAVTGTTSQSYVGGLVGNNDTAGTISRCSATGAVSTYYRGGGLVGVNNGTLSNCYAVGEVICTGPYSYIGGLVANNSSGTIASCYAAGALIGTRIQSSVGGLVGSDSSGTVSNSYWDILTSGENASPAGTGRTTAAMKQQVTFAGWDFADTWGIVEGTSYPYLKSSPPPFKLTVSVSGPGSVTVDPPSPDGTYAPGTLVTLTAAPIDPAYGSIQWTGAKPSGPSAVTVVMDIHRSVAATFSPIIEIASLADLAKIGNDPGYPLKGVFYLQTADIDASATAEWNDEGTSTDLLEGFKPIGRSPEWPTSGFRGIFDGGGHTISGLVVNRPSTYSVGFFGYVDVGGQVRNLGLAGGSIVGSSSVAGLVTYNSGTISNCYMTGAVTGRSYVGGLVAHNSGKVSNCYARSNVVGVPGAGGLIAESRQGTVSNSYWDVEASGMETSAEGTGRTTAEMKRMATYVDWDFNDVWGIAEGLSYPYLRSSPPPFKLILNTVGPGTVTADPPSEDGTYAPGTTVTLKATPSGPTSRLIRWTGATPSESSSITLVMDGHKSVTAAFLPTIRINSLAELAKIGNDPDYPLAGICYLLTADIDASPTAGWNDDGTDTDVLEGFKPIGTSSEPFTGVFDGNGHTINGLVINRLATSSVGLFGSTGLGCEVQKLGLVGGTITGQNRVGGLVGFHNGTTSDCYATCAVRGAQNYAYIGGLIGYLSYGVISNCHATSQVTASGGSWGAGGLVGYGFPGTVLNSYWDNETSGQTQSAGGTGKTTAEMKQRATFAGWDFSTVWNIVENVTYPFLRTPADHGDFNGDGFVNRADLEMFTACVTGPAIPYDPATSPPSLPGCTMTPNSYGWIAADFDKDGDVDQIDFGILQRCFTGDEETADPACGS